MSFIRKARRLAALIALCVAASAAPAVWFNTTELPWAAVGEAYHTDIQAQVDGACPLGDVSLSIVEGALPRGLTVQGASLTGVPKQQGVFPFRLRAANACGSADRTLMLRVTGKPILRVTPEALRFEYRAGDPVPRPLTLLVAGTWPEFAYSVTAREPWLRVRLAEGVTPSTNSALSADAATVEVLPKDLVPGWYETTLVVSGDQAASSPEIPVKLHVLPPPLAR
ncbi:MAG: putative Ig domain-containing protein [Acidobacteriia bacterium]|nr:putative Ig domain-containing protein [Terriglobia bacterium]